MKRFLQCEIYCILYILENNIVNEIDKLNSNSNEFSWLKVVITDYELVKKHEFCCKSYL